MFGIEPLIKTELFKILVLVCQAYRQYKSPIRAEICEKLILIEYLNSERLNTFSWTEKESHRTVLENVIKSAWLWNTSESNI